MVWKKLLKVWKKISKFGKMNERENSIQHILHDFPLQKLRWKCELVWWKEVMVEYGDLLSRKILIEILDLIENISRTIGWIDAMIEEVKREENIIR